MRNLGPLITVLPSHFSSAEILGVALHLRPGMRNTVYARFCITSLLNPLVWRYDYIVDMAALYAVPLPTISLKFGLFAHFVPVSHHSSTESHNVALHCSLRFSFLHHPTS
jgi:hypothetical protein